MKTIFRKVITPTLSLALMSFFAPTSWAEEASSTESPTTTTLPSSLSNSSDTYSWSTEDPMANSSVTDSNTISITILGTTYYLNVENLISTDADETKYYYWGTISSTGTRGLVEVTDSTEISNGDYDFSYSYDSSNNSRVTSTTTSIAQNFVGYYLITNSTVRGAAIYLDGKNITNITGDFIGNYTSATNGFTQGGAISMISTSSIGTITGDFIGNYAVGTTYSRGGAIFLTTSSSITTIIGDFIGNYIKGDSISSTYVTRGGAICLISSTKIESITGNIIANYLVNTSASSDTNVAGYAQGGAVYNGGTITFSAADGNDYYYQGNYVAYGADLTKSDVGGGFLYSDSGSTTFNVDGEDSSITIGYADGDTIVDGYDYAGYDSIAGTGSITKEGAGTLTVNSSMEYYYGSLAIDDGDFYYTYTNSDSDSDLAGLGSTSISIGDGDSTSATFSTDAGNFDSDATITINTDGTLSLTGGELSGTSVSISVSDSVGQIVLDSSASLSGISLTVYMDTSIENLSATIITGLSTDYSSYSDYEDVGISLITVYDLADTDTELGTDKYEITYDEDGNLTIAYMGSATAKVYTSTQTVDADTTDATYTNVTFKNVASASALVNNGTITEISDATFDKNTGTTLGGAIYNTGITGDNDADGNKTYTAGIITSIGASTGELALSDTYSGDTYYSSVSGNAYSVIFSGNTVLTSGGAIYNTGNIIEITNALFYSNSTTANSSTSNGGGAIHNTATATIGTISATAFINNSSMYYGGAIYNKGTITNIGNSTESLSLSAYDISLSDYDITLSAAYDAYSVIFAYNSVSTTGGVISNYGGYIDYITNTLFYTNTAGTNAGAIFNTGTIYEISDSAFIENTSSGNYGGAIYNNGGTITTIDNSIFIKNTISSSKPGGAIANTGTITTISNSIFTDNYAGSTGGAIYNTGTIGTITDTTFTGNTASSQGGAIWNSGTGIEISDSTFTGNTATTLGGAIYNAGTGIIEIIDSVFKNNTASNKGGAIYNLYKITISTIKGTSETETNDLEYTGNWAGTVTTTTENVTGEEGTTTVDNGDGTYTVTVISTVDDVLRSTATTYSDANGGFLYMNAADDETTFNIAQYSSITIGNEYADENSDGINDYAGYDSIAGNGIITKTGVGTLTVNSSMAYFAGSLVVSVGDMIYNNENEMGVSSITIGNEDSVETTASLTLSASDLTSATTIYGDGTLNIGSANYTSVAISSAVTGSGSIKVYSDLTITGSMADFTGSMDVSGVSVSLSTAFGGTLEVDGDSNITIVLNDDTISAGISSYVINTISSTVDTLTITIEIDADTNILAYAGYDIYLYESLADSLSSIVVADSDSFTYDSTTGIITIINSVETPDELKETDSYSWGTALPTAGSTVAPSVTIDGIPYYLDLKDQAKTTTFNVYAADNTTLLATVTVSETYVDGGDNEVSVTAVDAEGKALTVSGNSLSDGFTIDIEDGDNIVLSTTTTDSSVYYYTTKVGDADVNTTAYTSPNDVAYFKWGTIDHTTDYSSAGLVEVESPASSSDYDFSVSYDSSYSLINQILSADVEQNFVGLTSSSSNGSVFNNTSTTAYNITGNFIANYTTKSSSAYTSGGVIFNDSNAKIGDITGSFIGNYVYNSITTNTKNGSQGGAIFNHTGASIGNIVGDFIGNFTYSVHTNTNVSYYGAANGGAIMNSSTTSTIESITGNFVGNYAYSSGTMSVAQGGALVNLGSIGTEESSTYAIVGDFISNYAWSTGANVNYYTYGGAIYNVDNTGTGTGNIYGIYGDFISNYAYRAANVYGGAIYNTGTITAIEGNISGNYAYGNDSIALGGAVYNEGNITFTASDDEDASSVEGGSIYYYQGNWAGKDADSRADANGGFLYQTEDGSTTFDIDEFSEIIIGYEDQSANQDYDSIAGDGTITKTGLGTLTVNSSMAYYVGSLVISVGEMIYNNSNAIGASSITINSTGKLTLSATDVEISSTVTGSGTIALESSVESLTITGSMAGFTSSMDVSGVSSVSLSNVFGGTLEVGSSSNISITLTDSILSIGDYVISVINSATESAVSVSITIALADDVVISDYLGDTINLYYYLDSNVTLSVDTGNSDSFSYDSTTGVITISSSSTISGASDGESATYTVGESSSLDITTTAFTISSSIDVPYVEVKTISSSNDGGSTLTVSDGGALTVLDSIDEDVSLVVASDGELIVKTALDLSSNTVTLSGSVVFDLANYADASLTLASDATIDGAEFSVYLESAISGETFITYAVGSDLDIDVYYFNSLLTEDFYSITEDSGALTLSVNADILGVLDTTLSSSSTYTVASGYYLDPSKVADDSSSFTITKYYVNAEGAYTAVDLAVIVNNIGDATDASLSTTYYTWGNVASSTNDNYDDATGLVKVTDESAITAGSYDFSVSYATMERITSMTGDITQDLVGIGVANANGGVINISADYSSYNITGNFIANYSYRSGNVNLYGGAIYMTSAKINDIVGDFIGNYAIGYGKYITAGGAIAMSSSTANDITGDFIGNYAHGRGNIYGGAIYLTGSTVGTITGDFINNYIYRINNDIYNVVGGAIALLATSKVDSIIGDFYGNYVYISSEADSTASAGGGVIYLASASTIESITGDFIANYGESVNYAIYGGAIYNTGTIGTETTGIEGSFVSNYVIAATTSLGGAIYNTGTIYTVEGDFTDNYAVGTTSALGGAVYNTNTITFTASDTDNVGSTYTYSGNFATTSEAVNGVYTLVSDDDANGGFLYQTASGKTTFEVDTNSKIIIGDSSLGAGYDSIAGEAGSTITKTGSGALTVNSSMASYAGTLAVNDGTLAYTNDAGLGSTSITVGNSDSVVASFITSASNFVSTASIIVNSDGTLELTGGTLDSTNITNSGTISIAGEVETSVALSGSLAFNLESTTEVSLSLTEGSEVSIADTTVEYISLGSLDAVDVDLLDDLSISGLESADVKYGYITLSSTLNDDTTVVYSLSDTGELSIKESASVFSTTLTDSYYAGDSSIMSSYYLSETGSESFTITKYYIDESGEYKSVDLALNLVDLEYTYDASTESFTITYGESSTGYLDSNGNYTGDFVSNFKTSEDSFARGGAIYATNTTIGTITSSFVSNYVDAYSNARGGAIYASNTSITDIIANFIANYSTSSYAGASGGAIYLTNATINSIIGDFIANSATVVDNGNALGGAIYATGETSISTITGDFIANKVYTEGNNARGSAIYLGAYVEVGAITGDFIANIASSTANIAQGGAIYNAGTISSIYGDFINNSAITTFTKSASGGAIYNTGTISSICGDFINNYTSSAYNTFGGTIYNSGTITSIAGNFYNNSATTTTDGKFAQGGVIYMTGASSLINTIVGDFYNNYAQSNGTLAQGGAIYISSSDTGTIASIVGDFYNNYAQSSGTSAQGGAIYMTGKSTISYIAGDFYNNYAKSTGSETANGGAIYINSVTTVIDDIIGYFSGNYATTSATSATGGAISNTGTISSMIASFAANYATSTTTDEVSGAYVRGGAISNTGTITYIKGDFSDNYATTTSTSTTSTYARGGAIYNTGTIGSIDGGIDGDFSNNYASSVAGSSQGGAIYNTGTISGIDGNFINNYTSAAYNTFGGAIYNSGTIDYIAGDFSNNYVESSDTLLAQGGAIYMTGALCFIYSIEGDFYNNSATTSGTLAQGGAIYITSSGTGAIDEIIGDFTYNYVESSGTSAQGGAIYMGGKSTITSIEGYFSNNYAQSTGTETANGGAIYINSTAILAYIDGYFSNNYATTSATVARGGAISNAGTITSIEGYFSDNSATSTTTDEVSGAYVMGGAIYNTGTISSIAGYFSGNYATTASASTTSTYARGGAIYNAGTISVEGAFVDNYVSSVAGVSQGGAIYTNAGTVTLSANSGDVYSYGNWAGIDEDSRSDANGGFLYINGAGIVNFDIGYTYTIGEVDAVGYDSIVSSNANATINKEGDGTLVVNSSMAYFTGSVNVNAGIFELSNIMSSKSNISVSASGELRIVITSANIGSTILGTLSGAGDVYISLDTDSLASVDLSTTSIYASTSDFSGDIAWAESYGTTDDTISIDIGEANYTVSIDENGDITFVYIGEATEATQSDDESEANSILLMSYTEDEGDESDSDDSEGDDSDSEDGATISTTNGLVTLEDGDSVDSDGVAITNEHTDDPDSYSLTVALNGDAEVNGDIVANSPFTLTSTGVTEGDSLLPSGSDFENYTLTVTGNITTGDLDAIDDVTIKGGTTLVLNGNEGVYGLSTSYLGDYGKLIIEESSRLEAYDGYEITVGAVTVDATSSLLLDSSSLYAYGAVTVGTGTDASSLSLDDSTLHAYGAVTVDSGSAITLENDSLFNVYNNYMTIEGGATLTVDDSDIYVDSASIIFGDGAALTLDNESSITADYIKINGELSVDISYGSSINAELDAASTGSLSFTVEGGVSMLVGDTYANVISGMDEADVEFIETLGTFSYSDSGKIIVESLTNFQDLKATNANEKALAVALDSIDNTGDTASKIAFKEALYAGDLNDYIMSNYSYIAEVNTMLLSNANFANVNRARTILDKNSYLETISEEEIVEEATGVVIVESAEVAQIKYNNVAQLQSINFLGSKDASNGVAGYDYWSVGSTANFDKILSERALIGASIGGTYNKVEGDAGDNANSTTFLLNAYGVYTSEGFEFFGNIGYAHFWNDGSKNGANTDWDSDAFNFLVGISYEIETNIEGFKVTPLAMFNLVYLDSESATYTNGVNIDSQDYMSAKLMLGFEFEYAISSQFNAIIRTMYTHECGDETYDFTYGINSYFAGVNYTGSKAGKDAALMGLGLSYDFSETCTAYFDYNAYIYESLITHSLNLSVALKF